MDSYNLTILGSTGSIGTQALDIVRNHSDRFNLVAISANTNWKQLARQINALKPDYALLVDERHEKSLKDRVKHSETEILVGEENLTELATLSEADTILNGLVGFAGFKPTIRALEQDKKVALANKESLVVGGRIIQRLLDEGKGRLIPVDSEHSAMLQSLIGESPEQIEKIIITASGGPFHDWPAEDMNEITVEEALDHPNWSMGSKITVDSATMMNKGLEIIETYWLFNLSLSQIEAVVHPQSVIHSVVTFVDGSSKAQLGPPDMKVPIQYALTYPDRLELDAPRLNWEETFGLTFEPVDYKKFPCIKLAREAIRTGGFAPAVLNASNEIAVRRFLKGEIDYTDISIIVEKCLEHVSCKDSVTVDSLEHVNRKTRELAETI